MESKYVLITNGDNYYSPRFVEMAFEMLRTDRFDMVMWGMVHSHTNPGLKHDASYRHCSVYPMRNCIDIGSFIVRSKLARKARFRARSHDGDATYFEDISVDCRAKAEDRKYRQSAGDA